MTINLGLCCINTQLRAQKPTIFNSRSCIRKNYTVELAKERALQNVKDLIPMIEYNEKHNIKCFRLSSDIFPRFTDCEVESYDIDFARQELKKAGDLAKKYNHRILMHPGQYNQVGANTEKVFLKTIEDLKHHADILDAMGIDENGVLIVHGGGRYDSKEKTINRWIEQYFKLPVNVQKRLVLENCERGYSIDDVLLISKKIKEKGGSLPVVFDSHHYECWNIIYPENPQKSIEEVAKDIFESWENKRPVMHVSNQGCGKIGHHSDYIDRFPECFKYFSDNFDIDFDLEVEAKMKENAIFKLRCEIPWLK